jgi:hypothetical protein
MTQGLIRIHGARQHTLKNLDVDIRTGELTVVKNRSLRRWIGVLPGLALRNSCFFDWKCSR